MPSIWEHAFRATPLCMTALYLAPTAPERAGSEHCQFLDGAAEEHLLLTLRFPVEVRGSCSRQVSSVGAEYALPKESIDALGQSSMSTLGGHALGME
jgi:hypothetical protein